ncbi:MAG TPA: hypothetical protein VF595_03455 [Tepidisphaeraceae bacterium]|jgi:hypothetical protein
MALIDKLLGRRKSLSQLSALELRKEEILIGKQRDRLLKKVEDLATAKQKIFTTGSSQKSPELRKALAMDFELKTQEQVMSARELNLRSKELMTVSRLRLIQESREKGRGVGRLNLTDRDVAKINSWIDDDVLGQDMYQQRLDAILEAGQSADSESLENAGLTAAGQELMQIWDQVDRGQIKADAGYDHADAAVRRRAEKQD